MPSRVERGPDLRGHEPPVAATPDPLTGNRRTFQPGRMTFQTVSEQALYEKLARTAAGGGAAGDCVTGWAGARWCPVALRLARHRVRLGGADVVRGRTASARGGGDCRWPGPPPPGRA